MIVVVLLLLVLMVIGFWNQPVYRNYKIISDKVDKPFRIVHLSDLHNSSYGEGNKRLIDKVIKAKPDVIFLTGDMVDDRVEEEGAYQLIEGLQDYDLYYVTGNHENWHLDTPGILDKLESLGVNIVSDRSEVLKINGNEVIIAGLMDPARIGKYTHRSARDYNGNALESRIDEVFSQMERQDERFTVLLSHRPEYFELYEEYKSDLVLCGHAHGGQVRVPFLINGVYSPNQGLFPKYAGGKYDFQQGGSMIVSRGLSFNIRLPRVFNPPEVVVIDVE